MTTRSTRARVLARAAAAALLLIWPATASAHAELDVPTPKDGATVEGTPPEVSGTFTQKIDPDGSSLVLRDAKEKVVARGGPDPDDDKRMAITNLPELAPGTYEVRWTTNSAEDGEIARGTWSFTVEEVVATPAPEPTDTATPSAAATASATPEPTASPTPVATPAPTDQTGAGSDVTLPIIAGLAIVLIGAVALLSRRGRTSGGA